MKKTITLILAFLCILCMVSSCESTKTSDDLPDITGAENLPTPSKQLGGGDIDMVAPEIPIPEKIEEAAANVPEEINVPPETSVSVQTEETVHNAVREFDESLSVSPYHPLAVYGFLIGGSSGGEWALPADFAAELTGNEMYAHTL